MDAFAGPLLWLLPGHGEIFVIGGLVLLLFFGRRIPEIMRSLGKGVTQFKKGLADTEDDGGNDGVTEVEARRLPKEGVAAEETRTVDAPSRQSST